MKARNGTVKLSRQAVGVIEETRDGVRFAYSAEWLQRPGTVPVSLTLPLREAPYISNELHAFFENLLPEGWLLTVVSKKLKISEADAFGLLLATCSDCIGAVEIEPSASEKG